MICLDVKDLHAYYGKSHILHGVNFNVKQGEIVSLLGRNGAGRSTTLKTIMGLVPPAAGSVVIGGKNVANLSTADIARSGIAFVPEERLVFSNLTVEENLTIGMQKGMPGAPKWTRAEMYEFFPRLADRKNTKAGSLSGGEQQMLTICRSLLGNPNIILIDEPSEGLAPKIVERVMEVIIEICRRGVSVVLVEQKLTFATRISSRLFVMGHGQVVFEGTPEELRHAASIRRQWLEAA
jgi:branched-chain amino acid transport system ATP-binding protein